MKNFEYHGGEKMKYARIVPFEKLITEFENKTFSQIITLLAKVPSKENQFAPASADIIHASDLIYRYKNTYWLVNWPSNCPKKQINPTRDCAYLADSLKDAVRLSPNAEMPLEYGNDFTVPDIDDTF
jgi:hypothetical protein